jgi:hypothetical protein
LTPQLLIKNHRELCDLDSLTEHSESFTQASRRWRHYSVVFELMSCRGNALTSCVITHSRCDVMIVQPNFPTRI